MITSLKRNLLRALHANETHPEANPTSLDTALRRAREALRQKLILEDPPDLFQVSRLRWEDEARELLREWAGLKMNGLSMSELCYLFCCPPLPSRIAAKLAFLPPEPTYFFEDEQDGSCSLHLTERAEWQYTHRELEGMEVFRTRTRRGNNIACMYVKNTENPQYTILFTHGNAVDLGQMSSFFVGLGSRINCNVFSFDYSGYGISDGRPTEKNIYADAHAAWHALRQRYNVTPSKVILYGQSIGTVAAIDLATQFEVAGVILHSPLMSGMRVAFPDTRRTWFFDPFPSIDKISRVSSMVLVIHGTEDEVIDFSHGLQIYERAPHTVEPLWVEGAGHNDVELYGQYLDRLRRFIGQEIGSS